MRSCGVIPGEGRTSVGWLAVALGEDLLCVVVGSGLAGAAVTGVGGAGWAATGTALWHAAMDRNPASPIVAKTCCLIDSILLVRALPFDSLHRGACTPLTKRFRGKRIDDGEPERESGTRMNGEKALFRSPRKRRILRRRSVTQARLRPSRPEHSSRPFLPRVPLPSSPDQLPGRRLRCWPNDCTPRRDSAGSATFIYQQP
jgi:hypothetical protein